MVTNQGSTSGTFELHRQPDPNALAYSVKDAAHLLSIGLTKCRELVASGQLTSVRIDRRLLVTRKALSEYVDRLSGTEVGK